MNTTTSPANTQLRGNCQCCGRQQAVVRGSMSKHGYTVDLGWFNGVCSGNRHAPLQVSRATTDSIIAQIGVDVAALLEQAAALKAGTTHPERVRVVPLKYQRINGVREYVTTSWDEANDYARIDAVRSEVYARESRARAGISQASFLSQLADEVHGTKLIVVEMAEAASPIRIGDKKVIGGFTCVCTSVERARVNYNLLKHGGTYRGWIGIQSWRKLAAV
jgi:hypothetical protein